MPTAAPASTDRPRTEATARFDLRIERAGDVYRAEAFGARLQGAEASFSSPFSEEQLRKLRWFLEHPSRELVRADAEDPRNFLKKMGTWLFKAVFRDRVLEAWQEARGRALGSRQRLTLALHIRDAELLAWPWEYLHDPGDDQFLGLSRETPIVRYTAGATELPALPVRLPVRILVVIANPKAWQSLDGEREWEHLKTALADLIKAGKVALERLESATLPDLNRQLERNRYQVLHFIGHGSFDKEGGTLVLEDELGRPAEVSAARLATILHDAKLRLVVLNACHGARCGADDPFSGVAQSLIRREVAAVVAMQCSVSDQFAISFSRIFYDRLARGGPIDLAMAEARCGLFADQHETEWGSVVLYMRTSDGHLFDVSEGVPGARRGGMRWWQWLALALSLVAVGLFLGAPYFSQQEEDPPAAPGSSSQPAPKPRPMVETDPRCPSPPGLDMKFVFIDKGEFKVKRGKVLKVPEPICMSVFETTQAEWAAVMGGEFENGDLPASGKSHDDAQDFVTRVESTDPGGGYRLPRKEEWEYAHRARRRDKFSYGDDIDQLGKYANCQGGGDDYDRLAPVGQLLPNDFGLYDMQGNVWEWTSTSEQTEDGKTVWVRMGGSWDIQANRCVVDRSERSPSHSADADFGFRIVRKPVLP